MRFFPALLLFAALQSPALAQTDGTGLAARAKAAAAGLQVYLDDAARSGGRADFAKPPAAELFGRIFDVAQLNALPAATGDDLSWLMDWADAANQTNKAIMFFGIKRPADAAAAVRNAGFVRNIMDYQDQQAIEFDFLIRLTARESSAMVAFWQQLTPEQRTPIREQGFKKARVGFADMISNELGWMAGDVVKPANARRVSAAMRDTADTWIGFLLPDNRKQIMGRLQRVQLTVKDDETQENLAVFGAALAAAK